jgi:hypothetical protein
MTTRPGTLRFRVTAEVDVEVTDLDVLTQAALEQVEEYGFESAVEKDELVLEVMADPAAAVLEMACLDEYIDQLPGLISRRSDILVCNPNDHADDVGRAVRDVALSPALVAAPVSLRCIREYASRLTGLSQAELEFDTAEPAAEGRKSKAAAQLLAGALWRAAVVIVDQAFDDMILVFSADEYAGADQWGGWLLPQLPDRYRDQYTPTFVRALAATILDVTGRLTRGWHPPMSIAEELAVMFLLDEVENIAGDIGWTLPTGWRIRLEAVLGQDSVHLALFGKGELAAESTTPAAVANEWFAPYRGRVARIPYTVMD